MFNSGSVNEPIPHLLIIIDEFAELKKAEPEFMQELISVAQVGRSLGVHLLLATQNQEVLLTIRYGVIQDSEFVLKCRKGR